MSTYQCSICGLIFNSQLSVQRHIKNSKNCKLSEVITKIVIFNCDYCTKVSHSREIINLHKKVCENRPVEVVEFSQFFEDS